MTRKFILCFITVVAISSAEAQNTPDVSTTTVPAASHAVLPLPDSYANTIPLNYVRTWEPQIPLTSETDVISKGHTVEEVHRTTQYLDGLGRPLQAVGWQQSTDKKDMVSQVTYDEFGREQYNYLPFVSSKPPQTTDPTGDGYFKYDAYQQQQTFSQAQYPGETIYYGHTVFEASPLNRVLKMFAPGNSWEGSEGAGTERAVQTDYLVNDANDVVRIWTITNEPFNYSIKNVGINVPTSVSASGYTATYASGTTATLYKTVTTDERGTKTIEYKDLEGRVVLKKVQVDNAPSASHAGWLCTYYVYDDFGLLRFVIPPKAVAPMAASNNWTLSDAVVVDELCYRYEYDERQRMIAKKVPGSDWVYMVYDDRDRLVFTQDGNMRAQNQWMATLYDGLNRPVLTGMFTTAQTPTDLMTSMRGLDYTTPVTIEGMTVVGNPLGSTPNFTVLTKTKYDDYTFPSAWTAASYDNSHLSNLWVLDPNSAGVETLPSQASIMTRGMVTGTQVKVIEDGSNLATGGYLTTTDFYDNKARPIQVNSTNYANGKDVNTNLYDFAGKVISTYTDHTNPLDAVQVGQSNPGRSVASDMDYDHMGRLIGIRKRVYFANTLVQSTQIEGNKYDALGQLLHKDLGQKRDENGYYTRLAPVEGIDYEYNIRGWLKSMNKDYAASTVTRRDHWFGTVLSYDWGFGTRMYNGNISGITWKTNGSGLYRAYGFGYDNANRLLFADFEQYSTAWTKPVNLDLSVKIGDGSTYASAYDENGNIKAMQEMGTVITSAGSVVKPVDNLIYHYFNNNTNSNKLQYVEETGAPVYNLGDFTDLNLGTDDYGYDVNGNLVTDKNKNIQGDALIKVTTANKGIIYNYLNLPYQVTIKNTDGSVKGIITYIYDAAGNKLKKVTDENPTLANQKDRIKTSTYYIGSFTYEGSHTWHSAGGEADNPSQLQYIAHEEGRIREQYNAASNIRNYNFDYFIKDHLGNVRVVLTDEQKTETAKATMETSWQPVEMQLFSNVNNSNTRVQVSQVSGYPADTYVDPNNPNITHSNEWVTKLNGSNPNTMVGPARIIKVMTGDVITASVKSYYTQATTNNDTHQSWQAMSAQLITALFGGGTPSALGGVHALPSDIGSSSLGAVSGFPSYFNGHNALPAYNPANKPKAYLTVLFFDEQFNRVSPSIVVLATSGNPNQLNVVTSGDLAATSNGYAYIYVSNEGTENVNVFFDNLSVIQVHGPLVEENHYYPFGLTMAGISSQALNFGTPENNKLYNKGSDLQHHELSDGSGLELYSTQFRSLDPQLGRWWQIDPKPDMAMSLYSGMNDNPILHYDPLGDTTYLFNQKGVYVGMSNLNRRGVDGSIGKYETLIGSNEKKYQSWTASSYFNFNDPNLDKIQLNNMKIGDKKLQIVSEKEINYIMKKSGIEHKNIFSRFIFAGSESGSPRDVGSGNKMDFGVMYLNGLPGGGEGDSKGGFFIFGSEKAIAYNAMDGGNWLWGQGMKRLGFSYSTAEQASEANEGLKDPYKDQEAIGSGYFYNSQDKSAAGSFEAENDE